MAEYIEKEAFIEYEKRQMHEIHDLEILCGAQGCLNDLKKFPAANVRENVKANWTDHEIFPAKGNVDMLQSALCPKCKKYHTTPYSYYFTHYAYCPNCGAKMEVQDG